ncbi:YmfL family putative regulatory protein [uncultured Providencia sp.]|uniref:YmfL family putative regulatory protein n=1 Tax=uncultured Providencia sp. TaxID=390517 RepID=UPI0028049BC7|nr:YmfL family putative regulatory protein [uncultured Providencia sp.]
MSKQTLKEVVKEMCKAFPGGRSAMAGALGISETTFNNKLYEKNGCRFFDNDELEAMEELSGTKLLVEYHLDRHGMTAMEPIEAEKLDQVELFDIRMKLGAMQGALAVLIQESIADGILTDDEITAINKKSQKVFAYAKHFIDSLPVVYGVKA